MLVYDEKCMTVSMLLEHAAYNGYITAMEFAVSHGADDWNLVLCIGACGGYITIMEYAIFRGADNLNWALCKAVGASPQWNISHGTALMIGIERYVLLRKKAVHPQRSMQYHMVPMIGVMRYFAPM